MTFRELLPALPQYFHYIASIFKKLFISTRGLLASTECNKMKNIFISYYWHLISQLQASWSIYQIHWQFFCFCFFQFQCDSSEAPDRRSFSQSDRLARFVSSSLVCLLFEWVALRTASGDGHAVAQVAQWEDLPDPEAQNTPQTLALWPLAASPLCYPIRLPYRPPTPTSISVLLLDVTGNTPPVIMNHKLSCLSVELHFFFYFFFFYFNKPRS